MNNKTSDKVKGKVSKAKGEVKDQAGNAMNNQKMQASGKKDKTKGTFQDPEGDNRRRPRY
ncbi:CsbD family protein [Lentibacillus sediminis]|uniref:CsbD family protein n=1 Tax=Lentibacillus sediminis TaxID=1940529 RepID=UPI000C1BA00B|nr:CsbD family protein [Lentibacillus sediminis]